MPRPARLWIAVAAAYSHWLLAAAIQAACLWGYVGHSGAFLPLLETQTLAVSAALGFVAWLLAARRPLRWLILPVHAALSAFLLADQLFYKIAFDHLRASLFETGRSVNVTVALSSLLTQTDAWFLAAAAIAVAGEVWLAATLAKPSERRVPRAVWWTAGALFLAGLPWVASDRYYRLNEHPLVAAARDSLRASLADSLLRRTAIAASPVSGRDVDPALARLAEIGRGRRKRPNVVVVVIESVGAIDLLTPAGLPSPVYAPNLARLAARGATFGTMYVPFPATTRSLVALHTGGTHLTGSDLPALERRYQGPMLGRSMQSLGYTTALFSSERLDVEDCDVFLRQGGYDRFQDFEQDIANRVPENLIDSWGAREEYTLGLMASWLDDRQAAAKPFYLEYMTVATHHPYGIATDYPRIFPGDDPRSHYRNSIHYTDRAIGALVDLLRERGLLDDTLIVVTGDHGEAFGEHPLNFLHKSFLYEENVRGFLLLMDPRWGLTTAVRPARIASIGDVMPTVLQYIGAPEPSLKGRDLLAQEFETRPVFFHKAVMPEQWGLRDGNWKYIAEIRTGKAELYDLSSDPHEQHNLACANRDRVERYAAMCADWFVRSDAEYTARLEDYHPIGGRSLRPGDFQTPGPKLQSTGAIGADGHFTESTRIPRTTRPVVWDVWMPSGEKRSARWEWTSPSGKQYWSSLEVQPDWTFSRVFFPGPGPLERGEWQVRLWWDGQPALTTRFRAAD